MTLLDPASCPSGEWFWLLVGLAMVLVIRFLFDLRKWL